MRWQGLAMRAISEGFSVARPLLPKRRGLRILTYHAIGTPACGDILGLNTLSVDRFREHVDLLSKETTVPLLPLNIPLDDFVTAITFDDGYADNLHVAAPLLIEKNIPFTVFVTSDYVNQCIKGVLSRRELRELAQMPGVSIGSHGASHLPLTQCNNKQLHVELEDSKKYIEDIIGQNVTCCAYPHGAADMRVRAIASSVGYSVGVCSRFNINHPERDPLMLNRCVILNDDTPRVLQQKLRGDWDWYRWRNRDPLSFEGESD